MSEIKSDIEKNNILIFIISKQEYSSKQIEIIKNLPLEKRLCYVSLNKPYKTVKENLLSNNIDIKNILFIDTISKGDSKNEEEKNVIFTSSGNSLTELNIVINEALEVGKMKNLFFDSLSTLLIYEKPQTVSKFIHSLTAKLRDLNVNAIFISLKDELNPELLKNLYMFADKIIE